MFEGFFQSNVLAVIVTGAIFMGFLHGLVWLNKDRWAEEDRQRKLRRQKMIDNLPQDAMRDINQGELKSIAEALGITEEQAIQVALARLYMQLFPGEGEVPVEQFLAADNPPDGPVIRRETLLDMLHKQDIQKKG